MRIVSLLITNGDINSDNSFNIPLINEIYFNNTETRCWLNNVKYINTLANSIKWNHNFLLKLDQINHNTVSNKINYHDEIESETDITYYVKVIDGHYVYSKNDINGTYKQLEYLYLDSSRNSYIFDQRDSSNANKQLVFGTNMASTTNFGHELSHSTDHYTFALGSGDPTAVVITRVSNLSYQDILSNAGIQIPSSGVAQSNSADIGENYILLDFKIPYQHLDGGQVLFLGLTGSTSESGSSSDHDSRYDIDMALYVSTNILSPRISRGRLSGELSSIFRYTGFLHKQQLDKDDAPYNNSIPAVTLVDSLRINYENYNQYYNYYFNNVTAVGQTFLDKASDLGYSGYPQLIKYPFLTKTTLDGAITSSSTTLTLTSDTDFPTRGYLLLDDGSDSEVLYFTRSGTTCTIFKTTSLTDWSIGTAGPQNDHSDNIPIFNRTLRKLVAHRPFTGNSDSSKYYIKKTQLTKGISPIGTFNAHDFSGVNETLQLDKGGNITITLKGNLSNVIEASDYLSGLLSSSSITTDITHDGKLILISDDANKINIINNPSFTSGSNTLALFGLPPDNPAEYSGTAGSGSDSDTGEIKIGDGTDFSADYFEIVQGRNKINRISESTSPTTYDNSLQSDTTEIIWFPSNITERFTGTVTDEIRKNDFITPDANGILDISDYYVYPGLKWTRPVNSGNSGSGNIGMHLESSRWSDGTLSGDFMIKVMQYDFAVTDETDNTPDMLFFYEGILTFSLKKFYNQNKIAKHNSVQDDSVSNNATKYDTNIPTDITNNYEIVIDEFVNTDEYLIGPSNSRKFVRFFLSTQRDSASNDNQPVLTNLHFASYPLTTITYDSANFTQTPNGTAGSGTANVTLTNLHLSNQDIVFAYSENKDVDHDEINVINQDVLNNTDTSDFTIIKNTGNSALVNKEYYIGKINNQRITNFSGILETNGLNNIFSNSNGKILIELLFN